jgi:glycosyltransferase involved in cell wall biosynthesis
MTQENAIEIVTFSTLYPNAAQPNHGIFVENRLRHLTVTGRVASRVVAPVPWFPFSSPVFGGYARFARVPTEELRHGISVYHPKYFVLPKVGMSLAPRTMLKAAFPVVSRLRRERNFDLLDAHYFYPDGVAAVRLGRALGKPVVITARGSDVNLIPKFAEPRRMIIEAANQADAIIAVSQALKDAIIALGVAEDRITVLRNGVDLALFRPLHRVERRGDSELSDRVLLSIGHLIERKGHDLIVGALPRLPGYTLQIVGDGPERSRLDRLAEQLKVSDRIRFMGEVPHHELPPIYSGADALVLASGREGWPNVLLEAMACGTPVVASNIWGNPEVVALPEAGVLMKSRSVEGVVEAVERLFLHLPDRSATRKYAERFGWSETSEGQIALFERILKSRSVLARG